MDLLHKVYRYFIKFRQIYSNLLMTLQISNEKLKHLLVGSIFIVFFLYFSVFKRFHILFLEQNQLFQYNFDFLNEIFAFPGSVSSYIGRFFTQFFISSLVGALVFTLAAFAVFILTKYIYNKYNINSIILSIVPVWLLAILLSNGSFTFAQVIGFLFSLSFFSLYISIDTSKLRNIFYFVGWPLLFLVAGRYSFPIIFLCAFHELFYREKKNRVVIFVLYIVLGALTPYVLTEHIFYIPYNESFAYPFLSNLNSFSRHALALLLFWYPLLILVKFFLNKYIPIKKRLLPWNLTNILACTIIFMLMGFVVFRLSYNRRLEIMKGMDHYVQKADWEKVLKLSDTYPDYNTLAIYYTNLALYKTGRLTDRMFRYPQIGTDGLSLSWGKNSHIFYGSEVSYYLSNTNEAYRWSFEAMVQKGLNPRSLKRLVLTSIINGDNAIAEKFINQLNQTLFYRRWAQHSKEFLDNPALAEKDTEISQSRDLLVNSDFFAMSNGINLIELLNNHPENKMAYEYLMASLLLEKNLDEFGINILKMKDYGYTRIPVHFEEALIVFNSSKKMNLMPEGFSFNQETIRRYNDFASTYSMYKNDPDAAAKALKKRYGGSYWFYLWCS